MGIQSFDTANYYSNGASEAILGKAIKLYNLPREEIVVMTKVRVLEITNLGHRLTQGDLTFASASTSFGAQLAETPATSSLGRTQTS